MPVKNEKEGETQSENDELEKSVDMLRVNSDNLETTEADSHKVAEPEECMTETESQVQQEAENKEDAENNEPPPVKKAKIHENGDSTASQVSTTRDPRIRKFPEIKVNESSSDESEDIDIPEAPADFSIDEN